MINLPMYFFSNSPVKCRLTNVVLPVPPSPTNTSCRQYIWLISLILHLLHILKSYNNTKKLLHQWCILISSFYFLMKLSKCKIKTNCPFNKWQIKCISTVQMFVRLYYTNIKLITKHKQFTNKQIYNNSHYTIFRKCRIQTLNEGMLSAPGCAAIVLQSFHFLLSNIAHTINIDKYSQKFPDTSNPRQQHTTQTKNEAFGHRPVWLLCP